MAVSDSDQIETLLTDAGALIPDLVLCPSRRYPDKVAVDAGGKTLTFSELSLRASMFAGYLGSPGRKRGQRVALLAMNDLEYLEVRIGAQRAGAILVPLNYRLSGPELGAMLADAGADLMIVGRGLDALGASLPVNEVLSLGDGSYEKAIRSADPAPPPAGYPPEETSQICYTSGTTGRPKGVMLSNRAVHAGSAAMGHEIGASPDAIFLACTPMFHVGSQVGFSFTYLGATQVQLARFDVAKFIEVLDRTRPTHTQIVPTMLRLLLDSWGNREPPSLRRIMYGAAPMTADLLDLLNEKWGCELVNGYGSTEAMGISFLAPAEHRMVQSPSVGRSSTITSSRIVDERAREVAVGEVGEILARGPSLMSGYWENPEATRDAFLDGWLRTGDLGYRDSEGFLYLVDRRNDKIISGGENVFPSEVERVIVRHPAVEEVAVIGIPDQRWGEAVVAVAVARPGAVVGGSELIDLCREALAPYKVPKQIRISVEQLPRTATGKLQRRNVRRSW